MLLGIERRDERELELAIELCRTADEIHSDLERTLAETRRLRDQVIQDREHRQSRRSAAAPNRFANPS
jgi:hypothetical protein